MTASNVLVVGEALIDEVVEADRVSRHAGGSPANVAVGLARLGLRTRLHTAIGQDADGKLIERWLDASGVTLSAGSVTDQPTSTAAAVLSQDGSATYRFALSWAPRPVDDLGSPTLLHTGSLGAFLAPGSDVTRDALDRGRRLGALVSFDPNIRASLLPVANRVRVQFAELASISHLVKLSDEDAEYLYPGVPLDLVLDRIIAGGASVAAITRGADGAQLASSGGRVSIPSVPTVVVDTVGAGDSFMAALIRALLAEGGGWDGQPVSLDRLEAIGRFAARAAALTVSRTGADLPTLSELAAERESA